MRRLLLALMLPVVLFAQGALVSDPGTHTLLSAPLSFVCNSGCYQATQPVSGTFWQATQPVSGTFWQATQPVSGTFWQATQPVSGTVTANAGTNLNTSLLALESGGNLAALVNGINVAKFGAASFSLGQQLAAASLPIVLTAAQITTLTPPAAITNYALETGGNLATLVSGINVADWDGAALGAMANYGTSPGAVKVPGVNAFVTNAVAVTGTFWQATQPVSWTSQTVTAAQATAANLLATVIPNDGSANMGTMANFGTSPTGVKALNVNASLALGTVMMAANPCLLAIPTNAAINLTASGKIITGTSAKTTYICSMDIVTATAQNIALVEGTGSTCGTSTAGIAGGTTAATNGIGTNGGLTKGNGMGPVYIAGNATADDVCLLLSSSGQTSGSVQYVQR